MALTVQKRYRDFEKDGCGAKASAAPAKALLKNQSQSWLTPGQPDRSAINPAR
jgi:hypothetical protein